MGAYGYLKIPTAFTRRFPYDKETVADPTPKLVETDGEIRLVYVWKKDGDGKLVHGKSPAENTSPTEARRRQARQNRQPAQNITQNQGVDN